MKNDRRAFVKQVFAASGMLAIGSSNARSAGVARGQDTVVFSSGKSVASTTYGTVRGYLRNRVHTFKGIPYGANTAGKNRFMPPVKPEPWRGVRNTVAYGFACQQVHGNDWDDNLRHFVMNFDFGVMSEDCLNLNVWTQGLKDGAKRPVMVWIHGGGFQNGSSFELAAYDGENLSKRGNVVMVSVNHRLNVLGFLNLATAGGTAYAPSANAGLLDLVAALEWVRDNIESFGGDPGNVTIFGQSGGGGKVNALMAMPAAKGLFHKAIVQSGSMRMMGSPKDTARIGEELVKHLGVKQGEIEKLQDLPYPQLMAGASAALETISRDRARQSGAPPMPGLPWTPTADGSAIAGSPFIPGGPNLARHVPLIVGCTLHELSPSAYDESLESISASAVLERVGKSHGDKAPAIIRAYQKEYPGSRPIDILSMIESLRFGGGSLLQARAKAAEKGLPVYAYRFDWNSDICDGRLRAFHALDMAFTFDNVMRWDYATGGGERAQMLASRMSQAWLSFARTGSPNHRDLPPWPRFDEEDEPVMIFNDACEVRNHPDAEARRLIYG